MNKEEILRKSRLENHVQDERDKVISAQSTMVGMIGMTVIFLLLLAIRLLWKDGSLFDIGAMYFGYLAVAQFYQFALLRGKMRLFLAVGYTAVALLNLVGYICRGSWPRWWASPATPSARSRPGSLTPPPSSP